MCSAGETCTDAGGSGSPGKAGCSGRSDRPHGFRRSAYPRPCTAWLQELGISLPEIHDVDVQRVHVGGRDAYHITFTANGKPYSFYVDTHDGDIF